MKYYYIIEGSLKNNIGDVLQGMVAKAFLPSSAEVLDRENLSSTDNTELGYLVSNGWYMHSFDRFPPPSNITPLYISVHVANSELLRFKHIREHFKKHSPIGCRDHKTLKLFLGWGIPAYYSGCLTVTTHQRDTINKTGEGECLLVDNIDHPIPENVKIKLESLVGASLLRISHDPPDISGTLEEYNKKSSKHMESLLKRYCNARMVITTKIHCALPCIGMGANVLIVHPNPSDPRLDTVREFINIVSYDELLTRDTLELQKVNEVILEKRKNFLSKIVKEGIYTHSNPVSTLPIYKTLKNKSILKAKLYRIAVEVMKVIGVNKAQIKRVYGD